MSPRNPSGASAAAFVADDHYLVLRLELNEIKPPIWRRIAVPASITLDLLHDVIQVAMGWEDYHLHQFDIVGRRYTEDPEEPDHGEDENGVVLGDRIHQVGSRFAYLYDFGDGWRHTVRVERVERIPENHAVDIACLAGRRRCPPEDVGGPSGYATYLEALAHPHHEEHKSMLRWRGPFDADAFNLDEVNLRLAWLVRWSRPRRRRRR